MKNKDQIGIFPKFLVISLFGAVLYYGLLKAGAPVVLTLVVVPFVLIAVFSDSFLKR